MIKGFKEALSNFKTTVKEVKAYRSILQKFYIENNIKNYGDFIKLPVLDKHNYIQKFPILELVPNGKIPEIGYASSGSSGKPTFWFRNKIQEINSANTHEIILKESFNINKKDSVLVIICFSMGIWVAGNSETAAFRDLCKKGYNLTILTPGIEKKDIINIIKEISSQFNYTILAGYPPFIAEILHECKKNAIKLTNIKIITAGDAITENWRNTTLELIKSNNFSDIINIYGCADAGFLGTETPLSIFIRRCAKKNPELFSELFDNETTEPTFIQYNPQHIFFETFNNELLITTNAGIPLIRYNLHDAGKLMSFDYILKILQKYNLLEYSKKFNPNELRLPFIIKTRRTDVAVTFYALNIYPENLIAGIEDPQISKKLTGNFSAYNKNDVEHKSHTLNIVLELKPKILSSKKIKTTIQQVIFDSLIKNNNEYKKLYSTIGKKALPIIHLKKFGTLKAEQGLYIQKGKKTKIII